MNRTSAEIDPLPPVVKRLLASYRDGTRMPSDAFERVGRRLDDARPRRVGVVIVAFAAAAAVVVALVAADAVLGTVASVESHDQASDVGMPPVEGDRVGDRGDRTGDRAGDSASQPVPPAELAPLSATPATRDAAVGSPPSRGGARVDAPLRDESSAIEPPPSTLAAERRLLALANAALAADDPAGAMALVARHAREFPRGALVPEIAAVRAMARCRQQPANALAELEQFERAHATSVLLPAVRRACASSE